MESRSEAEAEREAHPGSSTITWSYGSRSIIPFSRVRETKREGKADGVLGLLRFFKIERGGGGGAQAFAHKQRQTSMNRHIARLSSRSSESGGRGLGGREEAKNDAFYRLKNMIHSRLLRVIHDRHHANLLLSFQYQRMSRRAPKKRGDSKP